MAARIRNFGARAISPRNNPGRPTPFRTRSLHVQVHRRFQRGYPDPPAQPPFLRVDQANAPRNITNQPATASTESGLGARQIFLTSHNPTALDAIDLFSEDQRCFVVRRNERGHTTVDRLEPHPRKSREEWQLAMNGRNLSQVWLDGDIPGAMGAVQ